MCSKRYHNFETIPPMKKFYMFLLLAVVSLSSVFSQIHDPVKWTTEVKKISETEYDLISTATIDPGWHLYSQDVPEDGPIPTYFDFPESPHYRTIGEVKEDEGITEMDPVFEMIIKYFDNKANFTQRIELTGDQGRSEERRVGKECRSQWSS